MKKIRIGHMGISHDHSLAKLETVLKYPEQFEVVGLWEPNDALWEQEKSTGAYAQVKRMDLQELWAQKPDAMLIEGFELDLVPYAQMCVDRGIHVHVDKPAGDDIHAFRTLLRDARDKNLVVQMAYMYRYNPAVQFALEQVCKGVLGEIYQVDAIMDIEHWDEKRAWLHHFDAGIMFFLGCHMVDLIYLFQGMPQRIDTYHRSTGFRNIHTVDHGFAVFSYPNGASIARSTSTEINGFSRRQLVICGSEGTIEILPLETGNNQRAAEITMSLRSDTQGRPFTNLRKAVPIPPVAGRYDSMMLDFAAYVRREKNNSFDYDYEFQVQKLVLAACGQNLDFQNMQL